MAMTVCRECQAPVSDEAAVCPACGMRAPTLSALRRQDRRATWYMALIAAVIAASIGGVLLYQHHQAEKEKQQQVCDFTHALGGSSC